MPDELPTVAFALLLVHVPPPVSLNVVVDPGHTLRVPVIPEGNGFTVTGVVDAHPVADKV